MNGGYLIIDDIRVTVIREEEQTTINDKQLVDKLVNNNKPVLLDCVVLNENDDGTEHVELKITAWLDKVILKLPTGAVNTVYTAKLSDYNVALQIVNDETIIFVFYEAE